MCIDFAFGGNDYVCRLEGMPDDEKYYNKICNLFGIKILTNDDFRKAKEGGRTDSEAVEEISKRLLYLAYKADKDKWNGMKKKNSFCAYRDSNPDLIDGNDQFYP